MQYSQGGEINKKQGFIGYVTDSNPQQAVVHFLQDNLVWHVNHEHLYPVGQTYIRPKWAKSEKGWEIEERFQIIQPKKIRKLLESEQTLHLKLPLLKEKIVEYFEQHFDIQLTLSPLIGTRLKLVIGLKGKKEPTELPDINCAVNRFREDFWNKYYSTQIVLGWR